VCKVCLEGNYHFCQNGALRTTIGINRNGGFARVCSVPLEQVAVLPANVTFEQGLFTFVYFCLLLFTFTCLYIFWNFLSFFLIFKKNIEIFLKFFFGILNLNFLIFKNKFGIWVLTFLQFSQAPFVNPYHVF
jgi:hypothetical protein